MTSETGAVTQCGDGTVALVPGVPWPGWQEEEGSLVHCLTGAAQGQEAQLDQQDLAQAQEEQEASKHGGGPRGTKM